MALREVDAYSDSRLKAKVVKGLPLDVHDCLKIYQASRPITHLRQLAQNVDNSLQLNDNKPSSSNKRQPSPCKQKCQHVHPQHCVCSLSRKRSKENNALAAQVKVPSLSAQKIEVSAFLQAPVLLFYH